jgi:hypothetical protein
LSVATFATLFVVPVIYSVLRRTPPFVAEKDIDQPVEDAAEPALFAP